MQLSTDDIYCRISFPVIHESRESILVIKPILYSIVALFAWGLLRTGIQYHFHGNIERGLMIAPHRLFDIELTNFIYLPTYASFDGTTLISTPGNRYLPGSKNGKLTSQPKHFNQCNHWRTL